MASDLTERAAQLYYAWCVGTNTGVTVTREWDDMNPEAQGRWIQVARQAKREFAAENNKAVDDLVAEIERIHSVLRAALPYEKFERVTWLLGNRSEAPEFRAGQRVFVNGGNVPHVVTTAVRRDFDDEWRYHLAGIDVKNGFPASSLTAVPVALAEKKPTVRDEVAHRRIDALQEVLAQMLSDLAVSRPAHDISAALRTIKDADKKAMM